MQAGSCYCCNNLQDRCIVHLWLKGMCDSLVCIGDDLDCKEGQAEFALSGPVNHLGSVHCPPV